MQIVLSATVILNTLTLSSMMKAVFFCNSARLIAATSAGLCARVRCVLCDLEARVISALPAHLQAHSNKLRRATLNTPAGDGRTNTVWRIKYAHAAAGSLIP
jgi:hypothetical protein